MINIFIEPVTKPIRPMDSTVIMCRIAKFQRIEKSWHFTQPCQGWRLGYLAYPG